MTRTPVADWQQLSALYEQADSLEAGPLQAMLDQLRAKAHPLLPQLLQMLEARVQVQNNDFLGTMPRLPQSAHGPVPFTQPTQLPASATPIADDWRSGSRVGPYRLVRHIGAGGMAEVWLAERDDGAFQRLVAIKLLFRHAGSNQRDSFAQRFARERDILASLHHPHIAGLHDAGVTAGGQPWLALEYVEGETLTNWCDSMQLGIEARVRLFRQVLLAVQYAHASLVIHRDLKPGNILVTHQGEVRLLDFGIAKMMESEGGPLAETELTRQAGRPLTVQYASPEQLKGQPLTTACDIYSLGVVLYELLCGERPYELKVKTAALMEQAILEAEPRAPSRRVLSETAALARGTTVGSSRKAWANDLDAIVLRSLAKEPSRRYGSVEAMRADLDRWLVGEPVEARTPSAAYRLSKFASRHKLAVAMGMAAVLSLVAVATVAVVMGMQAREDSARAGAARDFMLGLFKRADQEKARGADITARELLETGRKDVLTRLAEQPQLQAELLQGIGTIQKDMGEYVGADSTFADAAQLYARLGMPRDAAMARSAQADAAVRMGDMKLAQTLVQQARDVRGRPASDAELNARIDETEGWIAFARGDMPRAKDLFHQSHEEAVEAFGKYHVKVMDALRGQAYAERQLRNFDEALRLLDEMEATAAKTSGIDPRVLPAMARDRAELLLAAGHWSEALEGVMVALPKCASDLGPNHSECRELEFCKVNAMLRLGMASKALESLPTLRVMADDQKSPALGADTLLMIVKLQSAASVSGRGSDRVVDRSADFERLRSLVESEAGTKFGPGFRARAFLALAESKLRSNEPVDAERWIGKALGLQRRGDGSLPATLPVASARALQGVSMLQHGPSADAFETLRSAQDSIASLLGPDDPTARLASLNTAIALQAQGRDSEALGMVQQAEPVLLKAMGAEAPTYLRVRDLRDHLERAHPASTDAAQAKRTVDVAVDFFN